MTNGLSWTATSDWDTDGENQRPVAIDFSHQDPDFGLALVDKGLLYKTTGRGTSFFNRTSSSPSTRMTGVIAVDPRNDSNWYAYVGSGQFWRAKTHTPKQREPNRDTVPQYGLRPHFWQDSPVIGRADPLHTLWQDSQRFGGGGTRVLTARG
jgi:hypothetical protein